MHLSIKIADKIFVSAFNKERIKKGVLSHSLKHCFPTHLLDFDRDLIYIQDLLGYAHSKRSEIYTHISRRNPEKTITLIDTINLNISALSADIIKKWHHISTKRTDITNLEVGGSRYE